MTDATSSKIAVLEHKWFNSQNAINGWPLLWHLALRRRPTAMLELSQRLGSGGGFADAFSPRGLARRAYKLGDPTAAYNLAMDHFNKRDLTGYRQWIRRAAKDGFPDALEQLRHFDTRRPHIVAHEIGRGRPHRTYD